MKTLYVSDLDGTLLRSDAKISPESCRLLNGLIDRGMLFTYATARAYVTAAQVLHLVFHEGDKRRDNEAQSTHSHGGDLETQTFAATRRHECQRVATVYDGLNDLLL